MNQLAAVIDAAWETRTTLSPSAAPAEVRDAVAHVIAELDAGRLRVAEKQAGGWVTHQWIKKAVLLSFRLADNAGIGLSGPNVPFRFFDKVPTKFAHFDDADFAAAGVRVVPPAVARRGAYVAPNVVLMPSYVNIGAYVDEGTMVDTWATVGSCAQIGTNVHLSGGVGIGGVLEPHPGQSDHHRGQLLHRRALGSRRRRDRRGELGARHGRLHRAEHEDLRPRERRHHLRPRARRVGRRRRQPAVGQDGCQLYCAVIVKQVDAKTRSKTSINELLRA